MPLDIVLAGSGLEDGFLARARAADIGGATVPLIDLQDLIIAKLLASRPQDLADAQNLSSTTCPPSSGVRAHCQRRRSANGAGDRPPAVLPRYRPAATSRSHAPSRPPDRRRSDRSSGLRRRLLRRRFSCLPTHARLWHRPGRCDTDFLILIVARFSS